MKRRGVRSPWAYLPPALATWAGAYAAGVHPTLAGVALGLMTPARSSPGDAPDRASPLERLEHAFQPWVSFGIMPLFALANAGVALGDVSLDGPAGRVFAGVALGLALGKPVGVVGFSWIAVRLRAAHLPDGMSWRGMLVLGLVAGTGFTMSLFMTALALEPGSATGAARLAILAASAVAGIAGMAVGRLVLKGPARPGSRRGQPIGFDSARDTTA
jgi:NhaA family Na+:H+ antiporter